MPNQFKEHWPLSKQEKDDVWKDGTIVLDTNIYLHLYRLGPKERDQLFEVIENTKLLDRLWVPHQVALEFHESRLSVIRNQVRSAKAFFEKIETSLGKILKEAESLIRKHHPWVERERVRRELPSTLDSLAKDSEDRLSRHPVSIKDDQLLGRVHKIMADRIGEPFSAEERIEAEKTAKARIESKAPPGYTDAHKDGSKAYGDYFLWKQLLLEMKNRGRHALLVLDDTKEDWWLKELGKLIGPRPELRREYRFETGKEIEFVTLERFLAWANREWAMKEKTVSVDLKDALAELNTFSHLRREDIRYRMEKDALAELKAVAWLERMEKDALAELKAVAWLEREDIGYHSEKDALAHLNVIAHLDRRGHEISIPGRFSPEAIALHVGRKAKKVPYGNV